MYISNVTLWYKCYGMPSTDLLTMTTTGEVRRARNVARTADVGKEIGRKENWEHRQEDNNNVDNKAGGTF